MERERTTTFRFLLQNFCLVLCYQDGEDGVGGSDAHLERHFHHGFEDYAVI